MRFFLEFVTCCGSVTQRSEVAAQPIEEEEESSLVPPPSKQRHRRKGGRLGTSSAAEWRPSLGSISEDNVVPQRSEPRNGKVGSPREGKRRSGSSGDAAAAAAKVRHRYYGNDFGRAAVPTVIPAFSPTPFMF